jgi:hypothetical protein
MAFGPSFRGIAASGHAEKEDIQDYEFQKSGACGGRQDRKITLPSMIWVVRGPLVYGEVFPDAASRTSVWLLHDDEFSLGKACRYLSARS